jgi:hypothetical protein
MGRSLKARCRARQLAELAVSIGIRLGLADCSRVAGYREQSTTGEPCPEGSLGNLRNQAIEALIDLSMSGDISPFETIAYPGGGSGSDNFRASDHPRTGLVGGQKGVKEVCAFMVDHDSC